MNLKAISNEELIAKTENEIRVERASTLKIIKLFQEIYDRKLYLDRGFPSFYEMATKHFGYCAGSAMRRINAMKLVREMPQFEKQIESGELRLSVAADVQSFFYHEAKIERPYSLNAKIELVESCLGKSRKEAELEFARRNPEREKRETSYAVSEDRLRVSFSISKDLNVKLNQLKDLLSHVDPNMTTEHLLERLAELGLDKYDPQRKAARAKTRLSKRAKALSVDKTTLYENASSNSISESPNRPTAPPTSAAEVKRTRCIPANEKHQVSHDNGGCTYRDEQTGRRCGSKQFLQLDHITPFAQNGANSAENLRWMCGAHNRHRYQREKFH
jgi:hypothetical protein